MGLSCQHMPEEAFSHRVALIISSPSHRGLNRKYILVNDNRQNRFTAGIGRKTTFYSYQERNFAYKLTHLHILDIHYHFDYLISHTVFLLSVRKDKPEQTAWTLIRRHRTRRLIWVYTVCHSSSNIYRHHQVDKLTCSNFSTRIVKS